MNYYIPIKNIKGISLFKRNKGDRFIEINIIETNINVNESICLCHFTKNNFKVKDGIVLGAIVPQVNISYLCHPDANNIRIKQKKEFDLFEKNCNTCKFLQRLPTNKSENSLKGFCKNNNHSQALPSIPFGIWNLKFEPQYRYNLNNTIEISFDPNIHMNMNCYQPR